MKSQQQAIRPADSAATASGDVAVQVGLSEEDSILPGSRVRIDIDITNTNHNIKFDEIRVRVKEVQSWSSITASKVGYNEQVTETSNLTKKNLFQWKERLDDTHHYKVIELHKVSLDIPTTASIDQPKGLLRVHHFLQVKLVSYRRQVENLCFRFPLVIGSAQYEVVPADHPANDVQLGKTTFAEALAGTIGYLASTVDHLLEGPLRRVHPKGRPTLMRQVQSFRHLENLVG